MGKWRRITVLCTDDEFKEIQRQADGRSMSSWIKRMVLSQPGNGKANADRTDKNTARTPDVGLEGRSPGATGGSGRRGNHRHKGTLGAVEDIAHDAARRSGIARQHTTDVGIAAPRLDGPSPKGCKEHGLAFCKECK